MWKLETGALVMLTAGPAEEQQQSGWLRITNLVIPGEHKQAASQHERELGNTSQRAARRQLGLPVFSCKWDKKELFGERLLFFDNSYSEACATHPRVPVWGLLSPELGRVGGRARAQHHCTCFSLFYLCCSKSFQPCLSPLACSVSHPVHQKCLGGFSSNYAGGWDLISCSKPFPEVWEKPMQKFSGI